MSAKEFEKAVWLIELEYQFAARNFTPFASPHEGIAIIREEYLELEREVFHGTPDKAQKEAVQVAAMAIRFLVDSCGVGSDG